MGGHFETMALAKSASRDNLLHFWPLTAFIARLWGRCVTDTPNAVESLGDQAARTELSYSEW